ncbi:hypothetical protein FOCC_FOCC013727 [Frankliniella occidentalis]|nr:hypothetical protein FOCC_FOCC013727 [Frankliniella occidentalis]
MAELKDWIERNPNGKATNKIARCSKCDVPLRAHLADLKKHYETDKHKENMEYWNTDKQKRLKTVVLTIELYCEGIHVVHNEEKRVDLKLAMFIAVHSNIRSMDHLCELLKNLGKDSKLERLRLHRTKCSMLIKNVLSPALLTDLVADLNTSGAYSLIIDESTDVTVVKYLAVMVKYFSHRDASMKTEFLGILKVYRATAEALTGALKEYANTLGLNLRQHLVGLGSDGASALIGKHNSVYSRLKAEGAASEMPADLEFLVRETRNWFARSPLKRLQYRDLFAAINDGAMPANLVQLSATRWLAWSRAIDVVLAQWLELKTHFGIQAASLKPTDKCTIGRKLCELFKAEENRLYLFFLQPLTKALNQLNLKFQAADAEFYASYIFKVPVLISELHEMCITVARMFLDPKCVGYLASLLKNLLRILPEQAERFSAMKHLMPAEALKPYGQRPSFRSLPLSLAANGADMTVLQQQWDRMANIDWGRYFHGRIPTSSAELWAALWSYEIAGERRFGAIAAFALRVLSTPLSNATVERAFSIMNLTKTKIRNRMQTKMLEALLRLRMWSQGRHCCAAFEPTPGMYALFHKGMYDEDDGGAGGVAEGATAAAGAEMDDADTMDEIFIMLNENENTY